MEKHTNVMTADLFKASKDWDMALILVRGKNPVMVERDVNMSLIEDGKVLKMISVVHHPAPQVDTDMGKMFNLVTYVEVAEIYAVDYYTEKTIITGEPGMIKGMNAIRE